MRSAKDASIDIDVIWHDSWWGCTREEKKTKSPAYQQKQGLLRHGPSQPHQVQTEERRIETSRPMKTKVAETSVNEFGSGVFAMSISPETFVDKGALLTKPLVADHYESSSTNSDSCNCEVPSGSTPVLSLACGIAPLPASSSLWKAAGRGVGLSSTVHQQLQQPGHDFIEEESVSARPHLDDEADPPHPGHHSWQTRSSSSQLGSYPDSSFHSLMSSMPVLPIIAGFTPSSWMSHDHQNMSANLPTPIAASVVHSLRGSERLSGSLSGSISPYIHQVMMGASSAPHCRPENNLAEALASKPNT